MQLAVKCVVFAIVFSTCATAIAQSDPTGRWKVEVASIPWEVSLNADGSRLTGTVSSCSSVLDSFEIEEGKRDGNTIRFTCRSGDQRRVISFVGTMAGNDITFTWALSVLSGDPTIRRADDVLFGSSAPRQFTVKRIPDNATGSWQVQGIGGPLWEIMLRAEGARLSGTVSSCSSNRGFIDIAEGKADGAAITFTCHNLNGTRTLILTGRMAGNEIVFTWERRIQDGGTQRAADDAVFGPSAPLRFTAKRVPAPALLLMEPNHEFVRGSDFAAAANLPSENVKVEATLFIPEGVTRVRVLLMALEWGAGFDVFFKPRWPDLARTINGGLLRVRFSNISGELGNTGDRTTSEDSRDHALIAVLKRLADESGHEELRDAPLLFWGHSFAGGEASTFADRWAERTVGFVRFHSGGQIQGDLNVLKRIPALFFETGPLFDSGRMAGAPWTGVDEQGVGHGEVTDKATDLMVTWIRAVVQRRLSPDAATLRPVGDDDAWLGNEQTGEAAPVTAFLGSKAEATWLPDEASAHRWQAVLGIQK